MNFEKFKVGVIQNFVFGCPPFFAYLGYARPDKDSKVGKAIFYSQAFVTSHLTVLGFWFGATFGIAKHCFNKDMAKSK